jgi:hypothetical protein
MALEAAAVDAQPWCPAPPRWALAGRAWAIRLGGANVWLFIRLMLVWREPPAILGLWRFSPLSSHGGSGAHRR